MELSIKKKILVRSKKTVRIISYIIGVFFLMNIEASYKNLVKQKEKLIEEKKLYHDLVYSKTENEEEKTKTLKRIEAMDETVEYYNPPYNTSQNVWIWILGIYLIIIGGIFRLIDHQIEKLTETGKDEG